MVCGTPFLLSSPPSIPLSSLPSLPPIFHSTTYKIFATYQKQQRTKQVKDSGLLALTVLVGKDRQEISKQIQKQGNYRLE